MWVLSALSVGSFVAAGSTVTLWGHNNLYGFVLLGVGYGSVILLMGIAMNKMLNTPIEQMMTVVRCSTPSERSVVGILVAFVFGMARIIGCIVAVVGILVICFVVAVAISWKDDTVTS